MSNRFVFLRAGVALSAGALLLAGCGTTVRAEPATPTPAATVVAQVYPPADAQLAQASVSWAWGYGSLSGLVSSSKLVASGTITAAAPFRDENRFLYTDYTFRLDRVAKGDAQAGDTVVVHQTGGVMDGAGEEINDDPLMRVGSTVLLFLKSNTNLPDGSPLYFVAGGPQGRYPVDDAGGVGALGDLYPDRQIDQVSGIAGRTLDDVLAEAATYASLPAPDMSHPAQPVHPRTD